jgi:hypothetical protein
MAKFVVTRTVQQSVLIELPDAQDDPEDHAIAKAISGQSLEWENLGVKYEAEEIADD